VYLGCCRTVFENGREEEGVPGVMIRDGEDWAEALISINE
jgi:hypothetical protein